MGRSRTWDVSLDGLDHVITYTPLSSEVAGHAFAIDGRPLPMDWRRDGGGWGSASEGLRSEFQIGHHRGTVHWQAAEPSTSGAVGRILLRVLSAFPGGWIDYGGEVTSGELTLAIDDVPVRERRESPEPPRTT